VSESSVLILIHLEGGILDLRDFLSNDSKGISKNRAGSRTLHKVLSGGAVPTAFAALPLGRAIRSSSRSGSLERVLRVARVFIAPK